MLISLHLEIDDSARPDEIAAAFKLATARAEPYLLALGRPLRVDESFSLEDEMKGRLASILDCSITRSE